MVKVSTGVLERHWLLHHLFKKASMLESLVKMLKEVLSHIDMLLYSIRAKIHHMYQLTVLFQMLKLKDSKYVTLIFPNSEF